MTTGNTSQIIYSEIHKAALNAAKAFKRSEIELIEILEQVDRNRVYYHQGFSSLFKYTVDALGLSEEVAYIFINVCRKTREVPALKDAIKTGSITVSKAKKITSVLTPQNQNYWLAMAKTSTKRILEKTVASCAPVTAVREQLSYVNPNIEIKEKVKVLNLEATSGHATLGLEIPREKTRVQLQVGVSESLMLKLRRAQDLLSQKRQSAVGLEETLSAAIDLYISKNDPLEKAKRQVMKGKVAAYGVKPKLDSKSEPKPTRKPNSVSSLKSGSVANPERKTKLTEYLQVPGLVRKPVPAAIRHKLWIKSKGQCSHIDGNQQRCQIRRFLHIHHEKPVAQGGTNELSNLALLCAGHHRVEHL